MIRGHVPKAIALEKNKPREVVGLAFEQIRCFWRKSFLAVLKYPEELLLPWKLVVTSLMEFEEVLFRWGNGVVDMD